MPKKEKPYEPSYKGFDEEETRRAQATSDRARAGAAAKGELADAEYVEQGPGEYERRTGRSADELAESIEKAGRRKRA